MATLNIQLAKAGDFPALWHLASTTRVYLPELENDVWIAKKGTTIVGFIACAFAVDEMSILGLGVRESERRQGIATRLHHTAIETLRPVSCFLEVRESNISAQQLYKKWHYQPIGRRKNYYRIGADSFEDAIMMKLEITPAYT